MTDRPRIIRAANRVWDRQDFTWFDLIALSGRDLDQALKSLPSDQIEAVLEARKFNEQMERSL